MVNDFRKFVAVKKIVLKQSFFQLTRDLAAHAMALSNDKDEAISHAKFTWNLVSHLTASLGAP